MRFLRAMPVFQLSITKARELYREPEALFWVFVFPVLLALALGIAFRTRGPEELSVGVQHGDGAEAIERALTEAGGFRPTLLDPEEARQRLRTGRASLVVIPGEPVTYWYDPTRQESEAARRAVDDALQRDAGRIDVIEVETLEMTEKGSRYIDFLIPGLLGMNIMGTGMWGIGFYIVTARQKKLLKRLVATPMRRSQFLLGQIFGRLFLLVLEVGVLVAFATLFFDVPLRGSIVTLAFVSVLGAMTFAGMGLLVASRAKTVEGVSGLMNVVMMPLWILSGIFFSTSRFPDVMQPVVQALPLTALNDALREVMLDGAGLFTILDEVALTAAWGVATFVAALMIFRWR
jgi:ABC-type multidrug transport system permease subunit